MNRSAESAISLRRMSRGAWKSRVRPQCTKPGGRFRYTAVCSRRSTVPIMVNVLFGNTERYRPMIEPCMPSASRATAGALITISHCSMSAHSSRVRIWRFLLFMG